MLKCSKCLSEVKKDGFTSSGKQQYRCKSPACGYRSVTVVGLEQIDQKVDRDVVRSNMRTLSKKKVFVVTSAQNATPVHEVGLKTLKHICDHRDGQLVVQPYRYRNPNSVFSDKDQDWWVEDVEPYLVDERVKLHDKLILLGDVKVNPTAVHPLRGLHGFTSEESVLLGHPKIDMESVATRQGEMAKLMQTTGTITVQNYTDSKAGKKGIHHHSFGAALVEIEGDSFHVRTIQIDEDGCVIDLNTKYYPDGSTEEIEVDALIVPDLHQWWVDKKAADALFKSHNSLMNLVMPKYLVFHDLIDTYSVSKFHKHDPFTRYAKHKYGFGNVMKEIQDGVQFVEDVTPSYAVPVVVNSNHHDHIMEYMQWTDWRDDLENAEFYLETALYMVRNTSMFEGGSSVPDPFKYWVERLSNDIEVLGSDQSFKLHSYELGMHGHLGPNGSRGTPNSLSKVGSKKIVGHYHSPCRKNGLLAVGTLSTVNRDFTKGPSSWAQSVVLLYPNGKASHVHLINGKYRSRK